MHAICLRRRLEVYAIPTIAKSHREGVTAASALLQHICELRLHDPQPLVVDGRNNLFANAVAVMDQRREAFTARQASAVDLRGEFICLGAQRLIDAKNERYRVTFPATSGAAHMKEKYSWVVTCVPYSEVRRTANRAGQISQKVTGYRDGIGLRAVATFEGDLADQTVQTGRVWNGSVHLLRIGFGAAFSPASQGADLY